jgi:hypothetical protein
MINDHPVLSFVCYRHPLRNFLTDSAMTTQCDPIMSPPSEKELVGIRNEIEQWHERPDRERPDEPKERQPFLLLFQEQEERELLGLIREHIRSGNDLENLCPTPLMVVHYRLLHVWRNRRLVETYGKFIMVRLSHPKFKLYNLTHLAAEG